MLLQMALFLFYDEQYSVVYVHHIFFIHSSVDGHLGCFHVLAAVHNAAVNMGVQIPIWDHEFISFGCVPRSGVAGSYGVN